MATPILESAIPPRLQQQRTCPMRMPEAYTPAFPAYCARFPESTQNIIIAIIGTQHANKSEAQSSSTLSTILSSITTSHHHDIASVTDSAGFYNQVVLAYWDDLPTFKAWYDSFNDFWTSIDPATTKNGWFLEILSPSIDRIESIYSDLQPGMTLEAHGAMSHGLSGTIREHVYWGSMRDRLPVSQVDELKGETGGEEQDSTKSRVRVKGKRNLCVIRSGQDWSKTVPEERKLYLDTIHPVLIEGMNFLRDHGEKVGCYDCRFMDVLKLDDGVAETGTDRTFGLAYFDDIANLEKWSKEHKTHVNIFGGFLQYVGRLNNQVTLHLYHEVCVLKEEQQFFEYINCHPGTGMLRGLTGRG